MPVSGISNIKPILIGGTYLSMNINVWNRNEFGAARFSRHRWHQGRIAVGGAKTVRVPTVSEARTIFADHTC